MKHIIFIVLFPAYLFAVEDVTNKPGSSGFTTCGWVAYGPCVPTGRISVPVEEKDKDSDKSAKDTVSARDKKESEKDKDKKDVPVKPSSPPAVARKWPRPPVEQIIATPKKDNKK